jgi:hypothetical protein
MGANKVLLALASVAMAAGVLGAAATPAGADEAPRVIINRPFQDRHYLADDLPLTALYRCEDGDGDLASCVGDVAVGEPIDSSFGTHTFTVTATDQAGHVTTQTNTYHVKPMRSVCTATAARLGATRIAVANPAAEPCTARPDGTAHEVRELDATPLLGGLAPLLGPAVAIELDAAHAYATGVKATSDVAHARILAPLANLVIEVYGAQSEAFASFDVGQDCGVFLDGRSSIDSVQIRPYSAIISPPPTRALSAPMTIPLGIGTLSLNQTVVVDDVLTQRALFLDLPGEDLDVVLGEATRGFRCLPPP